MESLEYVKGAHWDKEIGALCEIWGADAEALLFDHIIGYQDGFRVLTNALNLPNRIGIAFGLGACDKKELVRRIREKRII